MKTMPWLALFTLSLGACATPGTLDRSLSRGQPWEDPLHPEDVPVCGYDIKIDWNTEGDKNLWGELLAVQPTTLILLPYQNAPEGTPVLPRVVEISSIASVQIATLPDLTREVMTTWSVGMVSTMTQYVYALYTAPVWLAAGIYGQVDTRARTRVETEGAPDPTTLQIWARFPAGAPPGLLDTPLLPCQAPLSPSQTTWP